MVKNRKKGGAHTALAPREKVALANARKSDNSAVTPERIRMEVRSRFNPLRSVTPELLSRWNDQYDSGYLRDIAKVWDAIEERDPMVKIVAPKRKKAASRLKWEIVTVDNSPEAAQQKQTLEFFYNNLCATSVLKQNQNGGVKLLIRQMMDSVGKGFAVHEIVWRPDYAGVVVETTDSPTGASHTAKASPYSGLTAEFRFCPLWFFENITGRLRFLESVAAVEGVDMPEGEWLVTVADGATMMATGIAYMFKNLPLKDWLALSEKFGMPGVLGKTDANKGTDRWNELVEAVQSFSQDFAAVCNNADLIELIEAKISTGTAPQAALVELMDRYIGALWRGADLPTMSAKEGPGQGASLQGDETSLLEEDDAEVITESLNKQVDAYVIRYQYGDVPMLARFLLTGDDRDAKKEEFKRAVWLGFQQDKTVSDLLVNQISLKKLTGDVGLPVNPEYEEPYVPVRDEQGRDINGNVKRDAQGDIIGGDSAPATDAGGNPKERPTIDPTLANEADSSLLVRAKDAMARAQAEDLQPLIERLAGCVELSDNPALFYSALQQLQVDLPAIREEIQKRHGTANVLEKAMTAALFNGMATGVAETTMQTKPAKKGGKKK